MKQEIDPAYHAAQTLIQTVINVGNHNPQDHTLPLIQGLATKIYQPKWVKSTASALPPEDRLMFDTGASCASALVATGLNASVIESNPTDAANALVHLRHQDNSILSPQLYILSLIVQGAGSWETHYRMLQKSKKVSLETINQIKEQIEQLRVVRNNSSMNIRQDNDDILPYLPLSDTCIEYWQPLFDELQHIHEGEIATYGGLNHDIFSAYFRSQNPNHIRAEVCPEYDNILGLRMPHTWYFNPQWLSYTTAMFYNQIQLNTYSSNPMLNYEFRSSYGIVGIIEGHQICNIKALEEINPGVVVFNTPYDLVNTATFIARHSSELLGQYRGNPTNSDFIKFVNEFLSFIGSKTGSRLLEITEYISTIQDHEEKMKLLLGYLKVYWQEALLDYPSKPSDEEIIVANHPSNTSPLSFDFIRSPLVVFIGGNLDRQYLTLTEDEQVVNNNTKLAYDHYPPQTKVIAPIYTRQGEYFRPHFLHFRRTSRAIDSLILYLLTARELGHPEYHDLRARYEYLATLPTT